MYITEGFAFPIFEIYDDQYRSRTLASFLGRILDLTRGFIEYTNPTIVRTCASKIFLPTYLRPTHNNAFSHKALRGFAGRAEPRLGIFPTPDFLPLFYARVFPAW